MIISLVALRRPHSKLANKGIVFQKEKSSYLSANFLESMGSELSPEQKIRSKALLVFVLDCFSS